MNGVMVMMILMIIMMTCSEFFLKFRRVSKQVRYQIDIKVGVEWMGIYLSNTSRRKLGFTMMIRGGIKKRPFFVVFDYEGVPWESEIFWSIFLLWWMP